MAKKIKVYGYDKNNDKLVDKYEEKKIKDMIVGEDFYQEDHEHKQKRLKVKDKKVKNGALIITTKTF